MVSVLVSRTQKFGTLITTEAEALLARGGGGFPGTIPDLDSPTIQVFEDNLGGRRQWPIILESALQ